MHLVNWKTACSPVARGALGIKISCYSTKLSSVNGFGDSGMRKILYGDWLLL
jgi:hypothetical protein